MIRLVNILILILLSTYFISLSYIMIIFHNYFQFFRKVSTIPNLMFYGKNECLPDNYVITTDYKGNEII